MSDFHIDLAIVKVGKEFPRVYQAPSFSGIKKDDAVIVEGDDGDEMGWVKSVVTISKTYHKEMLDFMLLSAGCREPLKKIRYKIKYIPMRYEDE